MIVQEIQYVIIIVVTVPETGPQFEEIAPFGLTLGGSGNSCAEIEVCVTANCEVIRSFDRLTSSVNHFVDHQGTMIGAENLKEYLGTQEMGYP